MCHRGDCPLGAYRLMTPMGNLGERCGHVENVSMFVLFRVKGGGGNLSADVSVFRVS